MSYKSQRMGLATDSAGARTRAYRAVVALVCSQCGRAIDAGQLFSRRSQRVTWPALGTATTVPLCVACRPLRLEERGDAPATLGGGMSDG